MNDLKLIIFPIISLVLCVLIFPLIIKVFKGQNWFEASGTHKIHSSSVPSMGGVAILISVVLTLLMIVPLQQWLERQYFFISIALIFLIGLRDDILALTPRQKLISQFLPVAVVVFLDRALLFSFYEWDNTPFPAYLSYLVSLLTVIITTNAYNLIDGIDGLAGAIGAITLTFFGVWFSLAGDQYTGLIALCFVGALVAFLIYNWQPSSIFMGDTGALTIGLILSVLAIRFINANYALPAGHALKFSASIPTAICVIIVPLFDTLRVILVRIRKLQSPFKADRGHIHHRFLAAGMSHAKATVLITMINLFFIGMAILLRHQSDVVLMPIIVGLCLFISFALWLMPKNGAA